MDINHDLDQFSGLTKLKKIMARLRSEEGCPWDREQTHFSLKKYLLEETYEVLQAIDESNMYNLREELGDLLLQVVFHAQMAEEEGEFTLEDIIDNLNEKMLRRHPHVFEAAEAKPGKDGFGVHDVNKAWEQIKLQEKEYSETGSDPAYLQTPKGLPALMYAEATQRKASQWGFDWPDKTGPWAKVYEELAELEQAVAQGSQQDRVDEMGDMLFSLVNVSRFIGVDPEDSLRKSTKKFRKRFTDMMETIGALGENIENKSIEELNEVWNIIKLRK
ncbi:MAG: nucleoside triphosphate pyrophosphohydrolase [Peptococcaceae bacterium]|nr:nucleoside triphosphate pyrophosphohydrolase [Peptococcaceae bacterium]